MFTTVTRYFSTNVRFDDYDIRTLAGCTLPRQARGRRLDVPGPTLGRPTRQTAALYRWKASRGKTRQEFYPAFGAAGWQRRTFVILCLPLCGGHGRQPVRRAERSQKTPGFAGRPQDAMAADEAPSFW